MILLKTVYNLRIRIILQKLNRSIFHIKYCKCQMGIRAEKILIKLLEIDIISQKSYFLYI